jgi:hypothetical protein
MNNIFLSSGACDSFERGIITTTLPFPIDIREDMGINLCELSFGGVINIPRGLSYQINGEQHVTQHSSCRDLEDFLNSLCVVKGYSFERKNGKITAKFPKNGEMEFGFRLQDMTGFPDGVIKSGDWVMGGGNMFRYLPYMVAEIDIVDKRPYGNTLRQGLRMVPLEYKNYITEWDHFNFQFKEQNFVPVKRGTTIDTIKFCLTTRDANVVPFTKGGSLQAHLQFCPVRDRLLV